MSKRLPIPLLIAALALLVLVFRPRGLFGERITRFE